ncbi:MAG: ABC transporter ATP-binding protein [Terriglobales bacterium]
MISVTICYMGSVSQQSESAGTHAHTSALLRVRGLTIRYAAKEKTALPAVLGVELDVKPGEIVGILGESGSGKSTLALSMLGLLPPSADIAGSIFFGDQDLLQIHESEWRSIRGGRIAMIFQEPGLALNPVMRAGDQIAEILRVHKHGPGKERRQQVEAILTDVGLADVGRIYKAYPHQLSGGELHRVAIAQALACRPAILIADEPTRSLDVTRQAVILNLLRATSRKISCALILITHDPGLLVDFADRVIVMYAGRIVEEGPVARVFRQPLHPYTKGLLELVPSSQPNVSRARGQHLPALPGALSDSDFLSPGCIFASRCFAKTDVCENEVPGEIAPEEGHRVVCFNYGS